jgi:hypothetical protein
VFANHMEIVRLRLQAIVTKEMESKSKSLKPAQVYRFHPEAWTLRKAVGD